MDSFLRPMLCSSNPVPVTGDGWVMEPKLDGWRAITHVNNMRGTELYARSGADYSGKVPYIEAELATNLPPNSAVDGELIGKEWGNVQSVMTQTRGPHVPTADDPPLTYVVFDITRLNGTDLRQMPWKDRRSLLENIDWDEFVMTNPAVPATQAEHDRLLKLGYEGTVSKRVTSRYTAARGQSWVKTKPQETAEAKIVGFKAGEGDLNGMVGAFEVEMLDSGAPTTVKCGTHERHKDATDHPENWLGQIIELKHHGIGKTGKPRHPQFLRRRDDHEGATAETPRQRQVRLAMAVTKVTKQKGEPGEPANPRMRNYKAMGDDKLVRVYQELQNGQGYDAYDRCMEGGSGEPMRDIAVVKKLIEERGLILA